MSASIELVGIRKSFGGTTVIPDLALTVAAGEFFTLLGSSGSGKTTTLMMIAGFAEPNAGDIRIGGKSVLALPPERRNLGVVFQSYALFPTMTVAQNVGFPLRMRRVDRSVAARKVADTLHLVDLSDFGTRRISQLSGGQQQRVALARALVFEPPVLLMDEPLGALDRKLREQLQGEIKRIQQALGLTVVYVTHDQEEALVLSDRIAVMADGEIRQMGKPAELYERPASRFVAQFLGESNFLAGRVIGQSSDRLRIELAGGEIVESVGAARGSSTVELLIRPESLSLSRDRVAGSNALPGKVQTVEFLGASVRCTVATVAGILSVRTPRTASKPWTVGDEALVSWRAEDGRVID